MLSGYSGGQMSRMVENVVLIIVFLIYGTMLLRNENNSCKKQGGFSHFRVMGDQTLNKPKFKAPT